ncbi:hypothetical protein [Actinoallomurus iriomotensis]|uniref:Uncharacterized protein n=1 Tax=Actinoallomurus iriomotensis TaxID=478107 RepID=A0A9W6W027_9ACTN|nr:hypothetical protein [Actinoallomurus iriomotensis]GLY85327.1 hypothetical protein Airi02_032560 [Actinoallomurus iriomotensis]
MSLGYLGVLALAVSVLAAVLVAKTPERIADETKQAICRMLVLAGIQDECAQPPAPPVAQAPPVTPAPPYDPNRYYPQQDCWSNIHDMTVAGALDVSAKIFGARAGHRVTVTTRRVVHPDGTVSYDVIVTPNTEGTVTSSISLGDVFNFGASIGYQGGTGNIYTFNAKDYGGDEDKTKKAAQRFADALWVNQAQDDAITAIRATVPGLKIIPKSWIKSATNWVLDKGNFIFKHIPGIGDNLDRAAHAPDRDFDKPNQQFTEQGPLFSAAVGFNPADSFSASASALVFLSAGVRTNYGSDRVYKNYYYMLNGDGEADADIKLPAVGGDKFAGWVTRVEELLSKQAGRAMTLPAATKSKLKANFPNVGGSVKVHGARLFIVSKDKAGNPTELRIVTEKQFIVSWQAGANGDKEGKGNNKGGNATEKSSVWAFKDLTQNVLPLDGPEGAANLKALQTYLTGEGDPARNFDGTHLFGGMSPGDFFGTSDDAHAFDTYIKEHGQSYRQTFSSKVVMVVGSGYLEKIKNAEKKFGSGLIVVAEGQDNTLTETKYYDPQRGWLDWTPCK